MNRTVLCFLLCIRHCENVTHLKVHDIRPDGGIKPSATHPQFSTSLTVNITKNVTYPKNEVGNRPYPCLT
jgi:hypothetical protein